MRARTIYSLLGANIKSLIRDRMSVFWYLAFPVVFIAIFGLIYSKDFSEQSFNVSMVAKKASPISIMLNRNISSVPAFTLHTGNEGDELEQLKKGNRKLVVVVPSDAKRKWDEGGNIEVPIYYDASQTSSNQVLLSYMGQMLNGVERQLTNTPQRITTVPKPVQPDKFSSMDYLLPGILGMALMQLGLFGSLGVVGLRQNKILKALGATPVPRWAFIASEIAVRILLSLVQTAIIITVGVLAFGVNVGSNWAGILGVVLLGSMAFVSLGYLLASFTRSVESGQGLVQAVQFPMMFFSGIFIPLEMLPKALNPVVKAIPLTYLGDALRQVMVGYNGQYGLTLDLCILGAWVLVSTVIASRLWKWE